MTFRTLEVEGLMFELYPIRGMKTHELRIQGSCCGVQEETFHGALFPGVIRRCTLLLHGLGFRTQTPNPQRLFDSRLRVSGIEEKV